MFDLCFRGSRGTLNYYILYQRVKIDTNFEYKIRRLYPPDASEIYTTRILEFGFACCNEKRVGEEFVIVFTDQTGSLEYVFCLCPNESYILCISSALPWCSCFRALLDIIWRNELYQDARWSTLETMLTRLMHTAPPPLSVSYVTCPDPFNIDRDLKFRIPTPRFPHTLKYVMEYYNSLDTSLWIHVFVCLLLERSVLFFSDRLTRLTSCILAAVSLLYPLQWVHSFYPIIPRKVIQVLECPVPFVAGIHACSLPDALDHLSSGTCLVDLDKGQMTIFRGPDNLHSVRLEDFSTPKAVYHFLSHQLKDVQNQLGDAMQSKKSKYANWKRVDGETCAFLDQLTRPFFRLIVNLLGCYPDCIVENLGIPEVDVDALVACQSCPGLESFMRNLCESQTVRLFLDNRARQIPDPSTDLFEVVSATLRADAKPQRTCKSTSADTTRYRNPAVPIAFAVNGSSHTVSSHRPNTSRIKSSPPYRPINFGSVLWLRSKKMKRPGEPYSWESLSSNMRHISGSKSSLTSHSWTQKLRAQASTLRNLSRSREYLSPENRSPASLHSEPLRASYRNRSRARTLAPPSSSMRPNPSNMQSKLTPSDSADLNISCVNTTLPSASAPLCPSAFETRASIFTEL
ncbi:hypothetical protein FGIG_05941 [Fasciola gigantica]|uniref:UDENN domain-containing protein n=1 Tax=Fasciola gigantica TaxID=46835 RepID=A0A504YN36_FASGI|nr:hypothetical protein FGIG_05941 [Fasciola gigantica]